MGKKKFKWDIWNGSSLFILATYLIFLVYPLGSLLKQAIIISDSVSFENFVTFFSKTYYSETLINSFKVSLTATVCALIVGILLAYLFAMYEFKGKKVLQILIIIASMSAPFVGAYSWILLLGRSGIITTFLSQTCGVWRRDIYR